MHCGQDVPWTASAKDGRLVCSRCGISPEESASKEPTASGHVPLNVPINDLHGAHHSGPSVPSPKDLDQSESDWPVASAYDGWNLDEQLSHIRQVLDSISGSAPAADADQMLDGEGSFAELSKAELRFDAMHNEKRGLHRRTKKSEPLMGRFVFGLTFLMLGTGVLVLSIASILPRQIWFPADVPITAVALQVFGVFLTGLGLSAQLRRLQAAIHPQEPDRQYRRFDEPQMEQQSPHVDVKVRS